MQSYDLSALHLLLWVLLLAGQSEPCQEHLSAREKPLEFLDAHQGGHATSRDSDSEG